MKMPWKCVLVLGVCALAIGCTSQPTRMGALPAKNYQVVGASEGSAGSFLLFGFIPINQNTRFQEAYTNAVSQRRGDDLVNVTITEKWYWAFVGNGFITTVRGDVIKYDK